MLLNAGREERTMGSRVRRAVGFPCRGRHPGRDRHRHARARGIWDGKPAATASPPPEDLSRVLFHELLLPFEVTSVLILIAILGAVRWPATATETRPRTLT
jgi:NADH-quinone oxidoreductase subunit J